jgi:hypothetical protein
MLLAVPLDLLVVGHLGTLDVVVGRENARGGQQRRGKKRERDILHDTRVSGNRGFVKRDFGGGICYTACVAGPWCSWPNTPPCQGGDRGFKSRRPRQI